VDEKELLTSAQAANYLNVTKRTILKWARARRIESIKISAKTILFTTEAIEKFLQSSTIGVESTDAGAPPKPGRTPLSATKKGGDKRVSGELWKDLRKEVKQWQ